MRAAGPPRRERSQCQAIKRDHVPERREAAVEFPSDLSVRPCDQQPHGNASASRSGTPALSFAETIGSISVGQSMPIAGSFQAALVLGCIVIGRLVQKVGAV